MATKRTGLGRGIGALIPTGEERASRPVDVFFPESVKTPGATTAVAVVEQAANSEAEALVTVPGARLASLNPNDIEPNAQQPRSVFDPEDLAELVHSVREFGVLQPIVVRPHPENAGKYELVMGERRLRASKAAGLEAIPAVVKDTANEAMLRDALLENLHRSQLNPLEEASAYQQLLEDFGCTHEELADRIGRSRPQISNTLRLLKLTPTVQRRVAAGVLSAGHARALVSVANPEIQDRLATRVVAEGLSVRALEEIVTIGPDGAKRTTARQSPKASAPRLADLATRLSERYDTRVKVELGRSKGKITVEFATIDDLERIVKMLDPT